MSLPAVTLVCASRDGLATLVPQINAFIDTTHYTIEYACKHGFLHLLKSLIDKATAPMTTMQRPKPQLYRSHVYSRALALAVTHDNDIALLECLHTYCPSGFASLGMEAAARVGKLDVMQWIEMHCEPHVIWSSRFALAAAGKNHVHVLQWLATKFRPTPDRFANVLEAAMTNGHLAATRFLFEQAVSNGIKWKDYHYRTLLERASAAGQFAIVQYVMIDDNIRSKHWETCLRDAAASGNAALVDWLYAQGDCRYTNINIRTVVINQHADVVRWMIAHDPEALREGSSFLDDAVERANVEITQLLHAFRPSLFHPLRLFKKLWYAAEAGDLAVVQWTLQAAAGFPHDRNNAYHALACAAGSGHLTIVQLLFVMLGDRASHRDQAEEWAVSEAAANGHADIVQWLHTHRTGADSDIDDSADSGDSDSEDGVYYDRSYRISGAAKHGHLELIQWMLAHAASAEDAATVLEQAAASGDVATFAWLHSYFAYETPSRYDARIIAMAVESDQVAVVQWLFDHGYGKWSTEHMDAAASRAMVEWFHTHCSDKGCTTQLMDRTAARGDFELVLFLHEHRTEGCTADAAGRALAHGHNVLAQWLFETYPDVMVPKTVHESAYKCHVGAKKVLFYPPQLEMDWPYYDGVRVGGNAVGDDKK